MRPMRLVVLGALLAVAACVCSAQTPVDPGIGLGGSGSCASADLTGSTETISVPTGCIVDITNDIPDTTLTFLTITVPLDSLGTDGVLSCFIFSTDDSVSPFSNATKTAPNACTFSGPPGGEPDAVLPGGTFGIELTQFNFSSLDITLSTVPEPGSLPLMLTGLVGLVIWSKRRFIVKSHA